MPYPSPSAKRAMKRDGTRPHRSFSASLRLYILCRTWPMLRLRVEHGTPFLWAADEARADAFQATAAKRPCSMRVSPPKWSHVLKWFVPASMLRSASSTLAHAEFSIFGDDFHDNIYNVV